MKYGVRFTPTAWDEYKSWQNDRMVLRRLMRLIDDLQRDPDNEGIGKRELLHGNLAGWRSARITDEHRLVYRITGEWIEVLHCRGHY